MTLEVSSTLIDELLAAARAVYPLEACGILVGDGAGIGGMRSCPNVHPNPATHFEIDPQALIDAHRMARAGGPQVVGYWHSHPAGPPSPSATDRAHATGDGRVWAIVALEGSGPTVGWWRDTAGGFVPLSYTRSER